MFSIVPMWENIFNKKNKIDKNNIKLLSEIPILENLKKKELEKVSDIIHERKYKSEENLFEDGNPGSAMFVLVEGTIEIEKLMSNGEVVNLAVLGRGDFLGELALLNSSKRTASAKCITETKVLVLFRDDLFEFIKREEKIGVKILKKLAEIIGERLVATNKILLEYKLMMEIKKDGD
ncbi:cyclic nucleotide-binding domain-containing protein [Haliovirga abyssi]|uniref:Cyclic nucleotide-binding domain-containing protein n=1 Tax=Haliovirga abyssi TaxID=2996794 RepID=A0AAU9DFB2_9FUSO|nr:cyclic nucleotide-binding domain-containing protein [Haliovirga abyssi]BDU50062.1 hypothetical protein HLVA_06310 [Haliovirga abyssi]